MVNYPSDMLPGKPPLRHRAKRLLFGAPRDLGDRSLFKHISLLPIGISFPA
jgi:hypothetical protein